MATEANANVKKNSKLATYFKGVKVETKKVVWPTRKTLVNYTTVVIAVSIVISLITYLLDLGIGYLYQLVL
ncbi:MAG: preprotein translocase subunit SecE [Ezakiella sp.]|nr:preprotein translocase subunit SecE [Ezakiella sp.]MDD7471361.1 preprotein translocase subunit SecE [Bacillota bacterium]MDY3923544.1 preprotein translocase subunit SecE [Ezakiella sp.]